MIRRGINDYARFNSAIGETIEAMRRESPYTDKKAIKRINLLIRDMQRSPFDGIGKPEPLKDNLSGWWSRRIDEENRIDI